MKYFFIRQNTPTQFFSEKSDAYRLNALFSKMMKKGTPFLSIFLLRSKMIKSILFGQQYSLHRWTKKGTLCDELMTFEIRRKRVPFFFNL